MNKRLLKNVVLLVGGFALLGLSVDVFAAVISSGIGGVAGNVTKSMDNIAKLITSASYVSGMAFAVGAIVKFKAHKDNPTQISIGMPISLLFIGAALIFMPSVFKTAGATLFGASGSVAGVSGLTTFGASKAS